jgi:hypothetical protein
MIYLYNQMSKKEFLDSLQSKFISRKLLVFVIACCGLFSGKLTSSDFVVIASTYMIAQGGKDIVFEYLKNKGNG